MEFLLCRIARQHLSNPVISVESEEQSVVTSEFCLFTRESVAKAKEVAENPDEPADWAMLTLQALQIELGKSYRQTIDLLSEIPGILKKLSSRASLTSLSFVTGSNRSRWRPTMRFSANQPSNTLATPRSTRLASIAISPHDTMPIGNTTASARSK